MDESRLMPRAVVSTLTERKRMQVLNEVISHVGRQPGAVRQGEDRRSAEDLALEELARLAHLDNFEVRFNRCMDVLERYLKLQSTGA